MRYCLFFLIHLCYFSCPAFSEEAKTIKSEEVSQVVAEESLAKPDPNPLSAPDNKEDKSEEETPLSKVSKSTEGTLFKTLFTEIHYEKEETLGTFLWRISGKRFSLPTESGIAQSRVDRIIQRVQDILDMHPDDLRIKIELHPQYKEGNIAAYSNRTKSIRIYVDKITDGIFAHEVAHAVINEYFAVPPPEKVQEILSQYVDRHLWDDYY